MNEALEEIETQEVRTIETTEETKQPEVVYDEEHAKILLSLDNFFINEEKFKTDFHTIFEDTILRARQEKGQTRVETVLGAVQQLYIQKNEYCSKKDLENSPELGQIIIMISDYLLKLTSELAVKEAQLHSEN